MDGGSISERKPSPEKLIFLASFIGLFCELALIRWLSVEIRVFAYFKNLVLVASFMGFGAGCLMARKEKSFAASLFTLLLLSMLVLVPRPALWEYGPQKLSIILPELAGFQMFRWWELTTPWSFIEKLLFAIAWTSAIFFAIALIMVPFGQVVGAGMTDHPRPLRAYSVNVAGSLAGILCYTAVTSAGMPPVLWFVPIALLCVLVVDTAAAKRAIVALAAALLILFLPTDTADRTDYWSSYQKLTLIGQERVVVNNILYQAMKPQPLMSSESEFAIDRITAPYAIRRPPGKVLIIGAGTGNDVAAALGANATEVVAVEIDELIFKLGRMLHPQQPYSDERVRVVIDDARHFLKVTDEKFDLIVFSHLDAHTLLSSYTNVRLDNYIHTVEAFQEARHRLAPQGLLYVNYYCEYAFMGDRLHRNLREAFGHDPVSLREEAAAGQSIRSEYFLVAEAPLMPPLAKSTAGWTGYSAVVRGDITVRASTDAWPFLPLEAATIPPLILLVSVLILLLTLLLTRAVRPPGEPFDALVFWLGAAFMLVEVHNVSRLALVFGTTWQVNAWVIGVILAVILVANGICTRVVGAGPRRTLARVSAVGLIVSLALAFFIPLDVFLGASRTLGGLAATLLMTLPVFFAGLVFAQAFSTSQAPGFALGWNTLGAVVGGLSESVSYVAGIPALLALAAVYYGLAIWGGRKRLNLVE